MQTKLIWITPDAEKLISYIARVSNPKNQDNPNYEKLIKYLIANRHWSPLEMVSACFEIKTSRAISAQIIRHRSFSYQEFSQRYAEVIDVEPIEIRRQAKTNRQSSEDVLDATIEMDNDYYFGPYTFKELIQDHIARTQFLYDVLVDNGAAKECARMIMPMASSTTIYMTGTLRSWIHYLGLRTDEHTQKEHRDLAIEIETELRNHFPIVFKALDELKKEESNKALLFKLLMGYDYQKHPNHEPFLMELLRITAE